MTPLDNLDRGDLADIPPAGPSHKDKFYYSEDTAELYVSDGLTWTLVSSAAGGGVPDLVSIGWTGSDGILAGTASKTITGASLVDFNVQFGGGGNADFNAGANALVANADGHYELAWNAVLLISNGSGNDPYALIARAGDYDPFVEMAFADVLGANLTSIRQQATGSKIVRLTAGETIIIEVQNQNASSNVFLLEDGASAISLKYLGPLT